MTGEELLEQLNILKQENIGFELFFITTNSEIKKVDLDIKLSKNLQVEFTKKVFETFNSNSRELLVSIERYRTTSVVSPANL